MSRSNLDQAFNLYASLSGNGSLGFLGQVTMFRQDEIRKTLSYYLDENYFLPVFYSIRMQILRDERKRIEKEFIEKLAALPPHIENKKSFKVTREKAANDIKTVNEWMEKEIDAYFEGKAKEQAFVVAYQITDFGALTKKGEEAKQLLNNPKVRAFLEVIKYAEAYKRVLGGGTNAL